MLLSVRVLLNTLRDSTSRDGTSKPAQMTREFPIQYHLLDDVVAYLYDVTLASFYSCNTTLIRHPTVCSIADARSSTGCRISKLKDSRQWTLCRNLYEFKNRPSTQCPGTC
jgi:hypothetical protein